MSWLQIELRVTPSTLEPVEEALLARGAVAITLLSDDNEPVLEPNPGETPLWSSVRMQALCALDLQLAELREELSRLSDIDMQSLQVGFVGEEDWQAMAQNHAVETVFADRLWLLPKSLEVPLDSPHADCVQIRLDPGLAFGSGSHPTTRLCLQWLAEHVRPGMKILDFGCGSGILAVAAAALGASVAAVDHDDQAIMATAENAAYNDLANITVMSLAQWQDEQTELGFDVIVANILAGPLQALAQEFETAAKPGASIVLSGILAEQVDAVMDAYASTHFATPVLEGGWACLQGTIKRT